MVLFMYTWQDNILRISTSTSYVYMMHDVFSRLYAGHKSPEHPCKLYPSTVNGGCSCNAPIPTKFFFRQDTCYPICQHVHSAIGLQKDCMVVVPALVVRLPDSHVYALGYGLPPM